MLALVVTLSGDCVFGTEMTEAERACCAAMGFDCGPMAKERSCCSIQSQRTDYCAPGERIAAPLNDAVGLFAVLLPIADNWLGDFRPPRFDGFLIHPSGVPTDLRLSTILI